MHNFWQRHGRFLAAFAIGLAAAALLPLSQGDRLLIGADLFFGCYLILMALKGRHLTPDDLRRHGQTEDEGITFILTLAVIGVGVGLWSVVSLLNVPHGGVGPVRAALAVASVPLGWATIHTVMAFHYARMYYQQGRAPGLDFPGIAEESAASANDSTRPGVRDFIYFSFTIGMTAQTADVAICRSEIRRTVTLHGALSFFYNTVILALTVNAAVTLGG
ncbi:MAG: DUF1345 domain-containing protein [Paracoccus sp. (in: a-proteobacteria)]|uniref:DUF1345 domain-containing protein n=1 Tax=Paracoccus sp. TaxID=267 RepID=UPI0026DF4AC9|nr:DUF1345 domain-containing protein [Paracoccus sp. (in: a-proteobacteria)]MDO5632686.1 DUF1345 domain-containing protein [Paracoccus sp. (in: a-proteobacteria)]